MAAVTNTVTVYRSRKLPPAVKAQWVSRWNKFHETYPEIPRDEWCRYNQLSPSTFSAWVADIRYNRKLRDATGNNTKDDRATDKRKAREKDAMPTPIAEASLTPAKTSVVDVPLSRIKQEGKGLSDEMRVRIKTEFYDDQNALGKKPYLVFASDKFRLTISEAMPAKDINMCIGYVRHLVERGY